MFYRTKTVKLNISWKIHFMISKMNVKKNPKHTQIVYSKCMLRLVAVRVLYCSLCLFVYGPFCHGALKLDLSTGFL